MLSGKNIDTIKTFPALNGLGFVAMHKPEGKSIDQLPCSVLQTLDLVTVLIIYVHYMDVRVVYFKSIGKVIPYGSFRRIPQTMSSLFYESFNGGRIMYSNIQNEHNESKESPSICTK